MMSDPCAICFANGGDIYQIRGKAFKFHILIASPALDLQITGWSHKLQQSTARLMPG